MCIPYASDSSGAPVGGLAGLGGTNIPTLPGLGGTAAPVLPNLAGSGTVPAAPAGTWSTLAFPPSGPPAAGTVPDPRVRPEIPALTGTEPVPGVPTPTARPAAPAVQNFGVDPLPQTSGHFDIVSQTGHDSLSPLADAIIARRGRSAPSPAVETAALPGTVPVSAPPAAATPAAPTTLAPGQLPDVAMVETYIRQKATTLGIDPNVAVAVAKSEGLSPGTWQSNIAGGGGPGNREPSFGPFQLHDKYMGADFTRATGLRASDPSTWKEQIDFVLGRVPTTGWSPFHGAAATGIGARQGLPAAVRGAGPSAGSAVVASGETAALPGTEAVSSADPEALAAAGVTPTPAATRGYKLSYHNKHSTRSQSLAPKLEGVYSQAAQAAGIDEIRVVSGGQPDSGPNRTGSHRHDWGNAGDIQLVANGHVLDMTNPADLEIIKKFISTAHSLGATGIGASPAYMGSRTFHVGFGAPAVWGAGGQGKNAPAWLVAATRGPVAPGGGTAVASTGAPATATVAEGGGVAGAIAGLGGGGAGGQVPRSGMDQKIEEFLVADAERRRKERDRLPEIGDLPLIAANMVPGKDIQDVGSLAQILGIS